MCTGLVVREATIADVDTLTAIINSAFEVERFFIRGDRTDPDTVRSLLRTGGFLIGEEGGEPVAAVYLEQRGNRGYFGQLAVAPAHKRHGAGRQLIQAVEDRFRRLGCVAVDIRVVNLREELPAIYRRLGYVENGTEPFEDARLLQPCWFLTFSKRLA